MCIEKENKDFKNPIEYKLEKKMEMHVREL